MKKRNSIIFCQVKIVWSGLVSAVEGKMGGSKFYQSKGNSIMSKKVRPTNKNTDTQSAVRASMKYYAGLWKSGATTFMDDFNAVGASPVKKNKIGTNRAMNGFNWYVAENNRNMYCFSQYWGSVTPPASLAVPLTATPPASAPTIYANVKSLTATGGSSPALAVDLPQVGTPDIAILYATAPYSAGKTYIKGKFRPIAAYAVQTAKPAQDILGVYGPVFGNPISGKKIAVQFEYVSILGSKIERYYAGKPVEVIVS
jgi:hypothetical protein